VPGTGAAVGVDQGAGDRGDDDDRFGSQRDKIISVATNDPEFSDYLEARDLPPHRLLVLKRFFQDYKQLEGKQVQVEDIKPAYAAINVIEKALARYKSMREELRAEKH
jgi:inorganic pyrophosphatase